MDEEAARVIALEVAEVAKAIYDLARAMRLVATALQSAKDGDDRTVVGELRSISEAIQSETDFRHGLTLANAIQQLANR